MKQLPTLTHLQFLVIKLLLETPSSGRDLRVELYSHGARKSGPAFYQMMSRLEDGELVEGRYVKRPAGGQTVRERHYEVTAQGRSAWRASREFYARASAKAIPPEGLSHA